MNRLPLLASSQSTSLTSAPPADVRPWERRASQVQPPYTLFVPMHYERNYAYPLLVWLQGPGDDERQLRNIMKHVSLRNYVGVGPRATHDDGAEGGVGYSWQQTDREIYEAQDRVEECIALASQRMNIARHRVFIGGFQCGGTMALRLAALNPSKFAGAISIGGAFPEGGTPLANLAELRQLPLFLGRNLESERFTTEKLCQQLHMFNAAHMKVNIFEYVGEEELNTKMLADMNVWMMERVTGVTHEPSEPMPYGSSHPN